MWVDEQQYAKLIKISFRLPNFETGNAIYQTKN